MISLDDIRRWRAEAAENASRPLPANWGGRHARMLTDQRDRRIALLCEEIELLHIDVEDVVPHLIADNRELRQRVEDLENQFAAAADVISDMEG